MRAPFVVTAAVLLLSGCLGADSDDGPAATQSLDSQPAPALGQRPTAFELGGTGCTEAGGHSVHPEIEGYLPPPWDPADILEDTGETLLYSELPYDPTKPVPEKGHTMGNYHATVVCEGWTVAGEARDDLVFGFVGMRVEAPPFDDGVATRHYLVTVVASGDENVLAWLHAAGIHATKTTGVAEPAVGGMLHTLLDTEDHGVYESFFVPTEVGEMDAGPYRLWWQKANDDGTFSPVAIDLWNTGGTKIRSDGEGWFSHTRTEDHAPIPGAWGHTRALGYVGFDRVVKFGPAPDVRLPEAYIHL
ncbi:MAG: hypothetical protein ACT4PT_10285 [Methanobacteriota archaeon]